MVDDLWAPKDDFQDVILVQKLEFLAQLNPIVLVNEGTAWGS